MIAKVHYSMAIEMTALFNTGTPVEYEPIEIDEGLDWDVDDEEE